MEIVRDADDREHFIDSLFILNDEYQNPNWNRELAEVPRLTRPHHWPEARPLVDIHAWTLLDNHLHMLIQVRDDQAQGLSEFAQRLFRSMTGHFNEKYAERGSIFQGPYRMSIVDSDEYLRYVIPYIIFKNVLDVRAGGTSTAARDFEAAWDWAASYPYSSFRTHIGMWEPGSHILAAPSIVMELFPSEKRLKHACSDMLLAHLEKRGEFHELQLEEW